MSIHTDQATVDRWLADGRWVQFAPGEPQFSPLHGDTPSHILQPADWKSEPCETCKGDGGFKVDSMILYGIPGGEDWGERCTDCNGSGVQRLAVTVPCPHVGCRTCTRPHDCCPFCDNERITVPVAVTVEWVGPIVAYHLRLNATTQFEMADGVRRDLPLGINPQTLVGQWARGGTIEVAT